MNQNPIIRPFRGIRYNPERFPDLSAVLSPPYDIINPERQHELYAQHPQNLVRLELAKTGDTDTEEDNRYTRAAADLQSWLQEGVLIKEEQTALYVVETEFRVGSQSWRRRGLFAAVRLPEAEEGYVLEHENTFAKAKQDRFQLMQATQAMISPVMSLVEDREGRLLDLLNSLPAEPDAVGEMEEMTHRLWVVRDGATIAAITEAVDAGPIYIADGHHRYNTARRHQEEMRRQFPEAPAAARPHRPAVCTTLTR